MAAQELLKRTDARESLIAFTEYTFPRYNTAAHHRIIAAQLERIERGEIDRLMLLVPPRHGKSELASKRLPAWYLGRQPEKQFLSISATAELAADFGREVRNIISGPEYQAVFDTTLAEDSQAKGKWHTSAGGIYYAVGVEGTLMGRGGHVILFDDPYASMQDALSETTRKKVWEFYIGTTYNRLMPGGAIVLINHRMHEDDLCGQLLSVQAAGGDKWEVVELPAISEKNEALWPEWYSLEQLERIRRNTFPRFWSALYQQQPTPDEGDFFKREWFRWYDDKPKHLRLYGASDYAVTADGGDYTVHLVAGVDPEDNIYIVDLWRDQTDSDVWIEIFLDLVSVYKPLTWAEEQGQILKSLGPFIDKRMRERKTYCHREQFTSVADKPTRCQAIRARAASGKVYLPNGKPWVSDFLRELMMFPAGKHDDTVDAFGLIGRMLDTMAAASKPKSEQKRRRDGYSERDEHDSGFSIKAA